MYIVIKIKLLYMYIVIKIKLLRVKGQLSPNGGRYGPDIQGKVINETQVNYFIEENS